MDLAYSADDAAQTNSPMSIRIVDEDVDGAVRQGPSAEDRVPLGLHGTGWLWLKRNGAIAGDISEVHVATVESQPVIQFTLIPKARDKFIALARVTFGHRLAFVLNDTIICTALIAGVPDGGGLQVDGNYTEAEARYLADELMKTIRPAVQNRF